MGAAGVVLGIDIRRHMCHEPRAPTEARAALRPLEGEIDPDTFETLRVLVTELVANSVRHVEAEATDRIELSVRASGRKVYVEVADSGKGFQPAPQHDLEATSGRGLLIVDALCDRWGVDHGGQTRVWCELLGPEGLAREPDSSRRAWESQT
jgi:two-component sensor histidine kinase